MARAIALSATALLVLALATQAWLHLDDDFIRKCLAVQTVASLLVLGLVQTRHPFPRFGLANQITLLRVALVAVVAGFIGETATLRIEWLAVIATATIAVLDGVDGWLARRDGVSSPFGARFDMETDAFLILVLSILVWTHDKAGVWVLACGLMRYAFVVSGWFLPWMAGPLSPTFRGRTVAVLQLVGLGLALSPFVPGPQSIVVAALTLSALVWSFALDVARLWRQRHTVPA